MTSMDRRYLKYLVIGLIIAIVSALMLPQKEEDRQEEKQPCDKQMHPDHLCCLLLRSFAKKICFAAENRAIPRAKAR